MLPACLVVGCSPADERLAGSASRAAVTASGAAAARRAAPRRGSGSSAVFRAAASSPSHTNPLGSRRRAQRFLGDGCTLMDCLGRDRAATLGVLPAQLLAAAGKHVTVVESRGAAEGRISATGFGAADLADDAAQTASDSAPPAWQSRRVAAAVAVISELPWAGPLAVRLAAEAVATAHSAAAVVTREASPAH